MNSVLSLQKLSDTLPTNAEVVNPDEDSDESVCCTGSDWSLVNCCNTTT